MYMLYNRSALADVVDSGCTAAPAVVNLITDIIT